MSHFRWLRRPYGQIWAGVVAPLLILLVACGGPNPVTTPTLTPLPPFQYTTIDLKLPPEALNAPVVGSVPADTILHVSVAFKTNQQVLNQLNQKKVPVGQTQNVQDLANKLGISNADYQEIKSFLGVENATLKLNSLHTNLTIDAKASTLLDSSRRASSSTSSMAAPSSLRLPMPHRSCRRSLPTRCWRLPGWTTTA